MGKQFDRMLSELDALDNGSFDVVQLSKLFDVSEGTIMLDFTQLRKMGMVDIFPFVDDGVCELCDKYGKRDTHHWTDQFGFHFRALCKSCNSILGRIFRGRYPIWRDQVEAFIWYQNGYRQSNLGGMFICLQ